VGAKESVAALAWASDTFVQKGAREAPLLRFPKTFVARASRSTTDTMTMSMEDMF